MSGKVGVLVGTATLAISHTPWVPERVYSLTRLAEDIAGPWEAMKVFGEKAPNRVWSEQMWEWAAGHDVDWCVFLQDDALVAPSFYQRFYDVANGAVLGLPSRQYDVIGLQVAHPIVRVLAEEGYQAFTTSDALIGVGYAIKRTALLEFLTWRALKLKDVALDEITEDTLLALWCLTTGRRIYHPIPTIVDHDTALTSTYGNDAHRYRRSLVRWDNYTPPEIMRADTPHVGRFYEALPALAQRWVKDVSDRDLAKYATDTGADFKRKLNYSRKARSGPPKHKIFVATPTRGRVSSQYAVTMWRLLRTEELEVVDSFDISDVQQWNADVVRIRSRFVSYFLHNTDASHLLFLDSDVDVPAKVVTGMLRSGKDFVCAPYPRRDSIDFARVREVLKGPAEALAYRYSVRFLPSFAADKGFTLQPDGTVEVDAMPLGCALISRNLLERMCVYYDHLSFDEEGRHSSVALFQLILQDRSLLSEDYSFCSRVREMGHKVHMYLGDGSPVDHMGEHCYRGAIEAFGLRRV